jgi:pyrrolidone-carboxylate peptidase
MVEGGWVVSDEDARSLGQTAGEYLWQLAKRAGNLASDWQFRRLKGMRDALAGLRDASRAREIPRLFNLVDEALRTGARGVSTLSFDRPGTRPTTRIVNVLITGFDPFNPRDFTQLPEPGAWNPSGAAVLALDGVTIPVEPGLVAAVEGVVLPVSYNEFRGGLVESILRTGGRDAQAVLTISLDPNLPPDAPIDLERYAVGVHRIKAGADWQLEEIPAEQGGGAAGPPIIETQAPLGEIASETSRLASRRKIEIERPTIGEDIRFKFASGAEADRALSALGLPGQGQSLVTISDPAALRQVTASVQRQAGVQTPGITFQARGQTFRAEIVRGPGGDILSNEVSFRVLRHLAQAREVRRPVSFHVHTPLVTAAEVERVRGHLIQTLRLLIQVVARRIGQEG